MTEIIWNRLNSFIENNKVPNIIFHGEHKSGKKTILLRFLEKLYTKVQMKEHVMAVNCAHGKGIKFVREELKQFAKTNIIHNNELSFKSVVLLNADTLTIDAQSALRRCIELFTNHTRFFIVVESLDKLLKPILSRFCQLYVGNNAFQSHINQEEADHCDKLLQKAIKTKEPNLFSLVNLFYDNGISALAVMNFIETHPEKIKSSDKLESILFTFAKMKKEFRNEKFLLFFLLNLFFLSLDEDLENLTFM
jgi:DNA polymerase III, delta subunit